MSKHVQVISLESSKHFLEDGDVFFGALVHKISSDLSFGTENDVGELCAMCSRGHCAQNHGHGHVEHHGGEISTIDFFPWSSN